MFKVHAYIKYNKSIFKIRRKYLERSITENRGYDSNNNCANLLPQWK